MKSMLNTTADFLIQQSWQIPIVFGIVLIICWGLRNASAQWRYLLWLIVIAKCLTPPMLNVPLAILPANSAVVLPARNAASPSTIWVGAGTRTLIEDAPSVAAPSLKQDQSVTSSPSMNILNSANAIGFNLRQWLVVAWIIVAGMLLVYVSGKVWSTDRRLRRTRLPANAETKDIVAALAASLGMRKPPTVYVASSFAQPFVWGWLRGDIYLPKEFVTTGSVSQRRAILTHELAHVARWDVAVNLIQIILQAVFFFHPLIWWANTRIRHEREKCCDEVVLSGLGVHPHVYCEAIVNMLALEHRARQVTPALAITGSTKNIAERITSILTPHREFCRRPSRFAVVTFVLVAASALPTAFVVTTQAQNSVPPGQADKPVKAIKAEKTDKAEAQAPEVTPATKDQRTSTWQPGQVMDFRVINAQTKEPIHDVTLELQNTGKGIDFQDVKTQKTDADGWSRIKLPDVPTTEVRVYPSKAGFVPLRVYWADEPHVTMPESITIPLEPGKAFGGIIQNEQGESISGVTVTVHYWGVGTGVNPHLRPNISETATSGKDGRWQLDIMPAEIDAGLIRIFVNHADYISDQLQRGVIPIPVTEQPPIKKLFDRTAVMVMRKGETIHGRVLNEKGRPIQNASIYEGEFYGPDKPRTKTDEDGNFRITGVELNAFARFDRTRLKLTIQAEGYTPEVVEIPRVSPLVIKLKPGQSVQGRVIDENGKPIDGVRVSASKWRGERSRLRLETRTDANGNFRLLDVPTDKVEYTFSKEGYMALEHFSMSPSTDKYSVTLKAPLRIVGTVVDAETGQPLDRFSIFRGTDIGDGRAPFWSRFEAKTITNGRYESIINQEGFSWLLRVEAEGYMPAVSRIFQPYNPDKGEVTFNFTLTKAKPLTGTVLGLDGEPLANADVFLATQQWYIMNRKVTSTEARRAKTDASGRFEFSAEVEPFCIVVVHEQGIAMTTENEFTNPPRISIQPWTRQNETLQIIRKPARGQSVDFPVKFP